MRHNLIMHFRCSECGTKLELVYPEKVSEEATANRQTYHDEPTGAACCYVPDVFISPCSGCIEKYTGQAKKLVAAVKAMVEA